MQNPVRELLVREYGVKAANQVLSNVVTDPNAPLTLSHINAMDAQLPVAGRFEQIHSHFKSLAEEQGLSDTKHLRFKASKRGNDDVETLGGLYLHSRVGNVFDYHDRVAKRRAAGREVWRTIAKDHGEAVANRVFRNVFGDQLHGHESDHGVELTLKDLDRLHGELGKAAPFSKVAGWAERYQKARPNLLLRYNSNGDLKLKANDPEWNRTDLGSDVERERNDAGYKVWQSIRDQYGRQVADRVFTKVFGTAMDAAKGQQITVGDIRQLDLQLKLALLDGQVPDQVLTELHHLSELDAEAGYDAVGQHHAKLEAPLSAPTPPPPSASAMRHLAGNAFQSRIDNRLIQAWEYTLASALEQDHNENRINAVVDVVAAAGRRGTVANLLMRDLSSKGLTEEGLFGDLSYIIGRTRPRTGLDACQPQRSG